MDIECHVPIDNENLIHFYSYFFLYFINFLAYQKRHNFYVDVEMRKLFLKMPISKKERKMIGQLDCRLKMTLLPPLENFADIVYLKEQSFLHRKRDVCTL